MSILSFPAFALCHALAYVRGSFYRWPALCPIPSPYRSAHAGLRDWRECWGMYRLGWIPYCYQRTPGYGWARLFIIYPSPEDLEWDRLADEQWARLADRERERERGRQRRESE